MLMCNSVEFSNLRQQVQQGRRKTFFAGGAVLTCGCDTIAIPQMRYGSVSKIQKPRGAAAPLAPLLPTPLYSAIHCINWQDLVHLRPDFAQFFHTQVSLTGYWGLHHFCIDKSESATRMRVNLPLQRCLIVKRFIPVPRVRTNVAKLCSTPKLLAGNSPYCR